MLLMIEGMEIMAIKRYKWDPAHVNSNGSLGQFAEVPAPDLIKCQVQSVTLPVAPPATLIGVAVFGHEITKDASSGSSSNFPLLAPNVICQCASGAQNCCPDGQSCQPRYAWDQVNLEWLVWCECQ